MKQFFYYLLIFTLLNTVTTTTIYAQDFAGGNGEAGNPFLIADANQLSLVWSYYGSNSQGKHFRLKNNITLTTDQWNPLGDYTNADRKFTGYFHGGGYTISGLKIDNINTTHAGLFGYNEGEIDSLTIEGTVIGGKYAGGLIGYNAGTITFCHANVTVEATSTVAASYSGGLVGYNTGVVQSSSATGNVVSSGSGEANSGGLVGYNTSNITNCFAKGNTKAVAYGSSAVAYAGGLVGYMSSGSVTNCYTTGIPTANEKSGQGAVIGFNLNGNISNCYYDISIVGNDKADPVGNKNYKPGTIFGIATEAMKTKDAYNGLDFNNVWGINSNINSGYLYLRNQPLKITGITPNDLTSAPDLNTIDTVNYIGDIDADKITVTVTASITAASINGNAEYTLITGKNSIPVTIEHDGGKLVCMITMHRKYTLSFDANGGTVDPASQTIVAGINKLPIPTRKGYDFKEWNTKKDGDSIAFDDNTVQNASKIATLYAQWTAKEYTVKFDACGGDVDPDKTTVTFDSPVGTLPEPTRTGYNFSKWYTLTEGAGIEYNSDTKYEIDKDTTLYAKWTPKSYNLHLKINYTGGSDPDDITVSYNKAVGSSLTVPTREGYTFKQWNTKTDGSGETYDEQTVYAVDHDTTIYAQWNANEYTVKFNTQTKDISNPSNIQVTFDNPVGTLPVLDDRSNFSFGGWSISPEGNGNYYTNTTKYDIPKDTTFYAQWKGDEYKLSFNINYDGGKSPEDQKVYYGSKVGELPVPSRPGYTFGGWFTGTNGDGDEYTKETEYWISINTTLNAKWTAIKYQLKYDLQGGSGGPASPSSVTFKSSILLTPAPEKANYTFKEWNTLPDGKGDSYANETNYIHNYTKDTTLYAQWKGVSRTLEFKAGDGILTGSQTKSVTFGEPVGPLPIPTRTGYTFNGWYDDDIKYDENTLCTTLSETTLLHATWKVIEYRLIFNKNYSGDGGTDPVPQNVTFGIQVGKLPDGTQVKRDKYILVGWNTRSDGSGDTYTETTIYNVNKDTELFAQWQGEPYTLKFNIGTSGITTPDDQTIYYGSVVGSVPTDDIRPGYSYTWNTKSDGTGVRYIGSTKVTGEDVNTTTKTLTLFAVWTAKKYTLTFDSNGGSDVTPKSITVTFGLKILESGDLPTPADRAGYEFKGWYSTSDGNGTKYETSTIYNVPDNSSIYAFWKGKKYTLSFDLNYAEGSSPPANKTVTYDSAVGKLTQPADRTNYKFKEWNTQKDGKGTVYEETTPYKIATDNAILYAIWEGKPHKLKFDPQFVSGVEYYEPLTEEEKEKEVTYGLPVGTLPVPRLGGYSFEGWFTEKDGKGNKYTEDTVYLASGDKTVYGHWKSGRTYTIYFRTNHINGTDTIMPIKNIKYGDELNTFTVPANTSDLFTFGGWNTAQYGNGTMVTDAYGTPIGDQKNFKYYTDITLYAIWFGNKYILSYNYNYEGNDNTIGTTTEVRYNSQVGILHKPTARAGYTFISWNTAKDGKGKTYLASTFHEEPGDITLYAQWSANYYDLTFNANGGTIKDPNTNNIYVSPYPKYVRYDAPITGVPFSCDILYPGYTFDGWYDGATKYEENTIYRATSNKALYAKWIAKQFILTFDARGGEVSSEQQKVTYNEKITLPDPERTGYNFKGWDTLQNGLTAAYRTGDTYKELRDRTLYAQWEAKTYIVSFDGNGGGTVPSNISLQYDRPITLPSMERANYNFEKWTTERDGTGDAYEPLSSYNEARNIKLYAQWTGKPYMLIFDATGGSVKPETKPVTFGSTVGELPTPERTGYTFIEWLTTQKVPYNEDTKYNVGGNTTLEAQWRIKKYTISFKINYTGDVNPSPKEEQEYNSNISLPEPTRTGYTFGGWKNEVSNVVYKGTLVVVENAELVAQWSCNSYTLIFDEQGGDPVSDRTIDYGATIGTLPTPDRSGYNFAGWFSNDVKYDKTVYDVEGNTTLYAKWNLNTYKLTFKVNYSNGVNPDKQDIVYDNIITELPAVSRTGYDFKEWNTLQNGNGVTYSTGMVYSVADDTDLYAQWIAKEYTLSFDANYVGSSITLPDKKVTYDVALGSLPLLTRTGYSFKGWNTSKDGTGIYYTELSPYTTVGHTPLYAQWSGDSYTLKFDVQGGDPVNEYRVTYDSIVGKLPTPTRTNYDFAGWFTEANGADDEYTASKIYLVTGNTTLYAHWTPTNYLINFDVQGGKTVQNLLVAYNSAVGVLPVSTRTGYTFDGWNTKKDGSGFAYTATSLYTTPGNMDLYAQWIANSYILKFDTQSDNLVADQKVTYDSVVGDLPLLSRTGYTFDGWYSKINGGGTKYSSKTIYTVDDNATLYANWLANKYVLRFDANYVGKDSDPDSREVTYGSLVSLPALTRQGHALAGWNTEVDGSGIAYNNATTYSATINTTLYAQWKANTYTIGFEVNYLGSVGKPENPESQSVTYGNTIGTLPEPTRTGYTFNGWNTAENGSESRYTETTVYNIIGNITLYAQWVGVNCKVSFTGKNVNLDPQSVSYGAKAVKPSDPVLLGSVFGGWYKDNDLWDFSYPVTGDIVLTAKWISSDVQLKNLTATKGTLDPEFQPSVTNYTIKVSYDVATISVTGIQLHSGASVSGNGEKSLVIGENVIRITVQAEDGVTTLIYTVVVIRADHILVPKANILNATAITNDGNRTITITGNKLEYPAGCGVTEFALNLDVSPYATIAIDGKPYTQGQILKMGGDTEFNIHVVSETGETGDYTLQANTAVNSDKLYYRRWDDIFGINANPDENGGYDVTNIRWYELDGTFIGEKGYVEMQSLYTSYYAEIKTKQQEGWRKVCGTPNQSILTESVIAYPNPVPYGESLKLELPEHFVGGTLDIYDIKGVLFKSRLPLPAKVSSIDVSNLGTGIYLLNITGKEGSRRSIKMIVE
ncbi:MAG: InlB B-repeat-containing protein [Prevotellaceae bacterium]|jgi:uncharacterized repeat protein (TIGR02543 family)|nr:InlB B-repeat-containing protein [Prevotellaceae bacterium]